MSSPRQIGIFGGSFNPVHCGHLIVASWIATWTQLDEVWLTLSPANPLKEFNSGSTEADRLAMLRIAVDGTAALRVCDIELSLPRPSFTISTLRHLTATHPDCKFTLIIGSDNWEIFSKWRAHDEIIADFGVMIYPRPGHDINPAALPQGVSLVDAPVCSLSSTFIRNSVTSGHSVEQMVPSGVLDYITTHNLYK